MGDALTKGTGTPWGPMESGRPAVPQYEQYDTNTANFMDSPDARQALADLATQGGDAQRNYLAGASKAMGSGTTSGSMQGRMANIAALAEKNKNSALTSIAGQKMDAFNRAKEARNRLLQGQYGADMGAYGAEQQGRGAAMGGLLGGLASLGGSYLGGQK
jgi:hypothetical protein